MAQKKQTRRLNGDGPYWYNEDRKKWRYTITVPGRYDEEGKPVMISVYDDTKAGCREKAKEKQNMLETGTTSSKEDITIYQLGALICEAKIADGTSQVQSYNRDIETLKRLKPVSNLAVSMATVLQLRNFMNDQRSYSDSVIKKEYQMLGRIFKEAVRLDIISKNPMLEVKMPKTVQKKTAVRALTLEEEQRLVKVLTTQDVPHSEAMLLSLFTGMRMGEVLALQVKDIDPKVHVIRISKTVAGDKGQPFVNNQTKTEDGMRDIRVGNEVFDFLMDCIADKAPDEFIFTNKGKIMSTGNVYDQFMRTVKKYGILDDIPGKKVTLHSLRHTYATRCIESGMQAKVLQHRLGHSDIKITYNTYGDVFEQFEYDNLLKADEYMVENGLSLRPEKKTEEKMDHAM